MVFIQCLVQGQWWIWVEWISIENIIRDCEHRLINCLHGFQFLHSLHCGAKNVLSTTGFSWLSGEKNNRLHKLRNSEFYKNICWKLNDSREIWDVYDGGKSTCDQFQKQLKIMRSDNCILFWTWFCDPLLFFTMPLPSINDENLIKGEIVGDCCTATCCLGPSFIQTYKEVKDPLII